MANPDQPPRPTSATSATGSIRPPVAAACNHPFTARHVPRCETQRCHVMSSLGRRRSGELLALQGRLRGVQDQGPVDWLEMGGVTLDLDVPES